uniref:Uncharacterized protein n=1 Tax=Amphimedon queenslandica TaxID=400682 RepID=A0A1X7VM26_AMPQE
MEMPKEMMKEIDFVFCHLSDDPTDDDVDKDDDGLIHCHFCRKPSLEVKSDDDDGGCMEDPPFSDDPLVNPDSPIAPVVAKLNEEKATNQLLKEPW